MRCSYMIHALDVIQTVIVSSLINTGNARWDLELREFGLHLGYDEEGPAYNR